MRRFCFQARTLPRFWDVKSAYSHTGLWLKFSQKFRKLVRQPNFFQDFRWSAKCILPLNVAHGRVRWYADRKLQLRLCLQIDAMQPHRLPTYDLETSEKFFPLTTTLYLGRRRLEILATLDPAVAVLVPLVTLDTKSSGTMSSALGDEYSDARLNTETWVGVILCRTNVFIGSLSREQCHCQGCRCC